MKNFEDLEKEAKENVKGNITKDETLLRDIFEKDAKEGRHELAKYLIEKYHLKTVGDRARHERLYIYQDGIYLPTGEKTVRKEVERIFGSKVSGYHLKEIIDKVKRLTLCDTGDFQVKDLNLVCVENGILNIKDRKLIPHSPDYSFTQKLPVKFNPSAKCPEAMKFLESILDEDDMDLFGEWFGFGLYRKYFLKKALIIFGKHDTGKTTLLDLLSALYGDANIAGVSLQALTYDRFGCIELYKKYLNIYDDLVSDDIKRNGPFKMATGRSYIIAEEKFGPRFRFINYAKMIFSANRIPGASDRDDDAYYSRWIIVEFYRQFDDKDKDPHLLEKITTPQELSGLLNWALDGLDRLIENEKFSYNKSLEEVKLMMQKSSSDVAAFVQDRLVKMEGNFVSKEEMYQAYRKYAETEGFTPMSKTKLGHRLPSFTNYIIDVRKWDDTHTRRERGWLNVSFREEKY